MSATLTVAAALYLVALGGYVASFRAKRHELGARAYGVVLAGLAVHTLAITQRWWLEGRPPVANMYESMILFAWAVVAVGALLVRGYRLGCFGPAVVLVGLLLLGASRLWDDRLHPLLPALKSPWLFWHVASCMIAYGALGVGWVASGLYLGIGRGTNAHTRQSRLEAIDAVSYHATVLGFVMLATGIITGSIWANLAWGGWWSWDPKETWALVTWLVYAIYLHHRLGMKWSPKKLAWFAVCAFPFVLFTYLGTNYLLAGLHSYAG